MAAGAQANARDEEGEVLDGLDRLVQAGRVEEVEELLTALIDSETDGELSPEEQETHAYARGVRDGLALARGNSGSS